MVFVAEPLNCEVVMAILEIPDWTGVRVWAPSKTRLAQVVS